MAVDPHFAGIGKVGAQLDKAEPELRVSDVEVIDRDAAIFLDEGIAGTRSLELTRLGGAVVGRQDRLKLLSHANSDHAGLRCGLEVRLDDVDLPVAPSKADDRDLVPLSEAGDRVAKSFTHLLEQRRGSNRLIAMLAEKGDHLAANLQPRNIRVQVDAVQAFEVKHNMPIEQLIDVPHLWHATHPRQTSPWLCLHFTFMPEQALGGPRLASLEVGQARSKNDRPGKRPDGRFMSRAENVGTFLGTSAEW